MVRHRLCGLAIAADAPLAGVPILPGDGPADVSVALRGEIGPPDVAGDVAWYVSPDLDDSGRPALVASRRSGDGSHWLRYSEGATFRIDAGGSCVDAWWRHPLTAADAGTYLLGPVLAFVLRLKGLVPLHASAVVVRERALVFLGDAGAGKSTTAAAFATLGYALLSDDVVPLVETPGGPMASPAYPRVSLWSDSALALLGGRGGLPTFSATYEKGYLDLASAGLAFQAAPVPVEAIFVLEPPLPGAPVPAVRPLGARERFLALAGNSYGSYLLDAPLREAEFDVLARLAVQVPIAGLALGRSLDGVRAACAALVEQMAAVSAPVSKPAVRLEEL